VTKSDEWRATIQDCDECLKIASSEKSLKNDAITGSVYPSYVFNLTYFFSQFVNSWKFFDSFFVTVSFNF